MSSDSTPGAILLWTALPILYTAILNAGEAAIVYTDDGGLRHQVAIGDKKAGRLLKLCENYKSLETAVLIVNLLMFVLSSYQITEAITWITPPEGIPLYWLSAFGVALYGIFYVAIGLTAPKRLAAYHPEGIAFGTLPILELTRILLRPIVVVIGLIGSLVIRFTGNDPRVIPNNVTEEEIRMLVDEGEEHGVIEEQEKDMINNIFEFDDRTVDEVMTHRTQVLAADVLSNLSALVKLAMETGYSRLPVYEEDIDSIVGIIYAKDLLRFLDAPEQFSVRETMRPALFVPSSTTCAQMLSLFKTRKTQIAIVIDEYGGTYGIVTMEDLLEAIVGNIQDEYDNETELCTELEEGVYILGGSMPINDVERLLDIQLPEDNDSDTIGGFISEILGGVPRPGDKAQSIQFGGVTFTATETTEKRIVKVRAVVKALNP